MNKILLRTVGSALVLLTALSSQLEASTLSVTRRSPQALIAEGALTLAPMGHVVFCMEHPIQCTADRDTAPPLALSAERMEALRGVNSRINRSIRTKADAYLKGMRDIWSLAPTAGDCEDYAITKRAELIRQGFPSGVLRLAVARTAWGEGHAVLIVRTEQGDLVLDNRHNRIIGWKQADLNWVSIQSGTNPRHWHAI